MLELPAFHFVQSVPFFSGLSPHTLEGLCEAASVHSYQKGQHIILRGDPAAFFYVVMSGWVKLYRETQEGEEAIIGLLGRTDIFGETSLFSHDTHTLSAQAVEDSKIIAISASALKREAQGSFSLIQRIMEMFTQQMNKLQLENEHLSLMSASQRVGCLLLQLSGVQKQGAQEIHLPYEKSLAASKLGMKPETFSRALAQLRGLGITVQGEVVKVNDTAKLVSFVCSDCSACDQDCQFSHMHHCHPDEKAACQCQS